MSPPLAPRYHAGTHRLCPPEETLARLLPSLSSFGITRCADVTGLDADLGMPVYMAIRPRGRVLQSSAGKGMSVAAAKVSALMEAVELDVAERPDLTRFRRAARGELLAERKRVDALPEWVAAAGRFFSDRFRIDWVQAEDLLEGGEVWLPAGAAYFHEPTPCRTSTNGLASGNHPIEATLHALYEVIERDAVARLVSGEELTIARDCRVLRPESVNDPALAKVIEKIERSATKVVLLQVTSGLPVPTYWALLLNRQPFAWVSRLNAGYGTHLDSNVALSRALGEAVQSRLTMIHGSRDDIVTKPVYRAQAEGDAGHGHGKDRAFRFFDELLPDADADADAGSATYEGDLDDALQTVLSLLREAGHHRVYRVDLACPVEGVSVVKVIVPSLQLSTKLL